MNRQGFSGVIVLLVVVVVVAIGFAAWQFIKNDNSQPVVTSPTTTESTGDCGNDRACFYQAYSDNCLPKTIKITRTTVEGDPIITTAKLSGNAQACIIEVTVDGSQDKFGAGEVNTYKCKSLARAENQPLTASECTGSSGTSSVEI